MHVLTNIAIAAEALRHNKLRTLLTSLGIIFGVASVIAMLSVGKGAEREILEQMKALGTNNVIIKALVDQKKNPDLQETTEKKKTKWSPGLNITDMNAITDVIPGVRSVSPEIIIECLAVHEDKKRTLKLVGIDSSNIGSTETGLRLGSMFQTHHVVNGAAVCVIGSGVQTKLFANKNPINSQIKCGDLWLTIVGVFQERSLSEKTLEHLGIRDQNYDVYAPYTTVLRRFRNRALLTKRMINEAAREDEDEKKEQSDEEKNPHQVDRLIVQLHNSEQSQAVAEVVGRLLARRHNGVVDFEIIVPELLLRQEQRTKDIFNFVLGAIAGISLIVGGIGIMNIMLASVLERTKEIGIRRAIGARKRDIVIQFLSETVALSLGGGIAGIIVGLALSSAIQRFAGITTVVSILSIIISFTVAAAIGLAAGIIPARRAAYMDPITALRYE